MIVHPDFAHTLPPQPTLPEGLLQQEHCNPGVRPEVLPIPISLSPSVMSNLRNHPDVPRDPFGGLLPLPSSQAEHAPHSQPADRHPCQRFPENPHQPQAAVLGKRPWHEGPAADHPVKRGCTDATTLPPTPPGHDRAALKRAREWVEHRPPLAPVLGPWSAQEDGMDVDSDEADSSAQTGCQLPVSWAPVSAAGQAEVTSWVGAGVAAPAAVLNAPLHKRPCVQRW